MTAARVRRILLIYMCAGALVSVASVQAAEITDLAPVSPQPAAGAVAPGLAVEYIFGVFDHVSAVAGKSGEPGASVLVLDMPESGEEVLTSGLKQRVAAKLRGLIRFDQPGAWQMRLRSNDGIRMWIAGKLVLEDPGYHNARWLDPVVLRSKEAGWYALSVDYFQRFGRAGLQVEWAPPGGAMATAPAAAYGHLK